MHPDHYDELHQALATGEGMRERDEQDTTPSEDTPAEVAAVQT
jgi:hypothetical protein